MGSSISTSRLLSSIFWDIRVQIKYGFYYVAAIAATVWIGALWFISADVKREFIGFFLLSNLNIGTFLFAAALVLYEKSDNTLEAMVVTPLRSQEYLFSKVGSLFLLALLENLLIVLVLFRGISVNYLWVILGIFMMAATYVLFGIGFAVKYPDFTEFIFPAILLIILLEFPLFKYLGLQGGIFDIVYLILPTNPSLALTELSVQAATPFSVIYSIGGSLLWLAGAYIYAKRNFTKYVIRREQ
ncbi:MAG: fluoroquinolone export ABC transporter permease subunit [Candidatus Kariarchaeaceae archaeon]|jgi:fluoroquinolone transport system permease protein